MESVEPVIAEFRPSPNWSIDDTITILLYLADPSGRLADWNFTFCANWTFFPVPLIQVLHHQIKGRGVEAFDDLDYAGWRGVRNLRKPDDLMAEHSQKFC